MQGGSSCSVKSRQRGLVLRQVLLLLPYKNLQLQSTHLTVLFQSEILSDMLDRQTDSTN